MKPNVKNKIYNYLNNNLLPKLLKGPTDITYHISLFSITNPKPFLKEWASTHNLLLHFDYYRKTIWLDKTGSSLIV